MTKDLNERLKRTFPLNWYPPDTSMPYPDMKVIAFCAEEVRRQRDTPWHVFRMVDAWQFAEGQYDSQLFTKEPRLTHGIIREIGKRIDEANSMGYRNGPVYIGGEQKVHSAAIMGQMDSLLKQQFKLTPIDLYAEFESIHPFFDGNGRVGKILYNWVSDSLADPVWPKDLYGGIENP